MATQFQAGFVNIFGPPNAGKSTLLNQLLGEQLVITSHKVQTTRHRILGFLNDDQYQIVFSDTPGIIEPKYKLHQKMMQHVKSALEDADVAIVLFDIKQNLAELEAIIPMLQLKVPTFLVLNKIDLIDDPKEIEQLQAGFAQLFPKWKQYLISAKQGTATDALIPAILEHLPEAPAYYPEDALSDRPVRFFVSELIREQIYNLYHEEIPYHTAVIIQSFEEKSTLTVIKAEIIVTRETQKMILLGKGGSNIKQLGIRSREKIEAFIDGKVHLELFIKVRPKWRDNDNYLK